MAGVLCCHGCAGLSRTPSVCTGQQKLVTVHRLTSEGAGVLFLWAAMALQRNWKTALPCTLRVCVTIKTRSTKWKPFSLWQPKEIFRHRTRLRRALGQVVG